MQMLHYSYPRPWAGYKYPKKKRRYVPTSRTINIYTESVVDTVTLSGTLADYRIYSASLTDTVTTSDDISLLRNLSFSLSDSITLAGTLSDFKTRSISLSQSVTTSQVIFKIGHLYLVSVSHDVTSVQIIRLNRVLHFNLTQSVTTAQAVNSFETSIVDTVGISQTIAFTRALTRTVTDNVTLAQTPFVNSPRRFALSHNISLYDFNSGRNTTNRQSVVDNTTLTDAIYYRFGTFHVDITDTISIIAYTRVTGLVIVQSVVENVTIDQRVNLGYLQTVVHDINVYQSLSKSREVTRTITTSDTLTSNFARDLVYTLSVGLNLTSLFDRTVEYTRDFESDLVLTTQLLPILYLSDPTPPIDGIYVPTTPHPIASGVQIVYSNCVVLDSGYGTLILPVPELNDSIKQNDVVEIKRSMTGQLSSYVKRSRTQTLKYTWILDFNKAQELRAWAIVNYTRAMGLANWKGEVWVVQIITDLLELKAESAYGGRARQKTSVTLEFEGNKIYG